MTAKVWWKAEAGKVHKLLLPHVRAVDQRQRDTFDRFQMHEAMYDPNGPAAQEAGEAWQRRNRGIKENVIAISVDTAQATIAPTEVRARFMTDGGDWSTQRRARLLELWAEEVGKLLKIGEACKDAFRACALKGTGAIRVYADQDRQLRVEPLMVDNIIADDRECEDGAPPRQIHIRRASFDCDALVQEFPEHELAIMKARDGGAHGWRRRRLGPGESRNDVVVVESIRLPMGVRPDGWEDMTAKEKKASRYVPGCHAIVCEGVDLLVEEWHKPHFGIAAIRWSKRDGSWYGISLAERIVGHQRVLDERNRQRHKQLEYAVPTFFGTIADPKLSIQKTEAGNYIPLKGPEPKCVVPTVIGMEIANDRHDARASAIAEIGLNEMQTQGTKPAGVEAGVAIREMRDVGSQRFSMQEHALERLWLDVVTLLIDVAKDLGDDAPQLSRQSRFGTRKIRWSLVYPEDVQVQIAAASTLARTPAGRTQAILELTQAGALNADELRKLLDHPDLKRTNSLYTASMEAIEHDFEMIKEGTYVLPDPALNLQIAQTYGQCEFLIERENGAPEEVLEGLRAYFVTAAEILSRAKPAAPDPTGGMGGAPAIGGAIPPGTALPGMEGAMPLPPMPIPQQVANAAAPIVPAVAQAAA